MGRKGASEYGGHVILPDSVLQSLLARDIQYPMLFKLLVEDTKKAVYCGVTEFTAPPNVILFTTMDDGSIRDCWGPTSAAI